MKSKSNKNNELYGLCYRCEHRARYLEEGYGPRMECQIANMAVSSCYMYMPVVPLKLKPCDDDKRPPIAPYMFAARSYRIGIATDNDEFSLDVTFYNDKSFILFWKQQK